MNEIESGWLDYARNVIEPRPLNECCGRGAILTGRIVRWPGYLGSRYEEARVLLVGAIHNENQLFTPQIKTLEAEVKTWLSSGRSDASDALYLRAQREAYEQSFDHWTGQVWNNFRKLIKDYFKVELCQTAFTNLAKCYLPPGDASVDKCVVACAGSYPIAHLVCRLRPIAVLVAKSSKATDTLTPRKKANASLPLIFRFGNANTWAGKMKGRNLEEWAPEAAELYRKALSASMSPR